MSLQEKCRSDTRLGFPTFSNKGMAYLCDIALSSLGM